MVLFLGVTGLSFARHAIYGLLLYMAVLYLHPQTQWWGYDLPDLRWSLLAAALAFAATFVHRPDERSLPLFNRPIVIVILAFLAWVVVQSIWAVNLERHLVLVNLLPKYVLLMLLIYRCIDTPDHLRLFLWAHVLGGAYMGWDAYSNYTGGRFEGFGGPDISEANAGALQIVTAVFCGAGLFVAGQWKERLALLVLLPLMVNGIILTESRSSFLAAAFGGIVFNYFAPKRYRARILGLSVIAMLGFAGLANEQFWDRINTIKYAGEQVEGVDTGGGRVEAMAAQLRMFRDYPEGCGHRCTAELSPLYMEDWMLTGVGANRGRSSHNTALTFLVEHGIPGILFYATLLGWLYAVFRSLYRQLDALPDPLPAYLPGIAAAMAALVVGDIFVDYLKLEVRFWLIGAILVVVNLRWLAVQNSKALEAEIARQGGELKADPAGSPADGPPGPRPGPAGDSGADTPLPVGAHGSVVQRAPLRSRYKSTSDGAG